MLKLAPWSKEEKERLVNLAEDSDYQHKTGSKAGSPHWKRISEALNREFHLSNFSDGIHIRNPNLCITRYRQISQKVHQAFEDKGHLRESA